MKKKRTKISSISLAAVAATAVACSAAGCGGSDSTGIVAGDDAGDASNPLDSTPPPHPMPGDDSGMDATIDDAPNDTNPPPVDAHDGATTDANDGAVADASDSGDGGDAGVDSGCSGTNTACGAGALCKTGTCTMCTDPTDDALCTSAYAGDGGADAGASSYICKAGTCTAGDCRTSATCTGKLCGVTTANFCGSCATDGQCKADATYGAATICNPTLGTCVSSTCVTPNQACSANAGDFCCAAAGVNTCVAGNCCSNAQCVNATPACSANACKACDAVANGTYTVDPVNGSDTLGNGSNAAGGIANGVCAFKTVAKAIAVVTALAGGPAANTKIVVLGPNTVSTALTGEAFPWIIPVNTLLSSSGGAVTANVTAAVDGVRLRQVSSGIQGFILDGQTNTALHGILVGNGASSVTTTIRAVTTRNFLDAGIRVEGTGGVAIGPATLSTGNGTAGAGNGRSGLRVTDTGVAVVSSATDGIGFNNNTAAGIEVDLQGSVTVTGTPGATLGTGTVVTNGNVAGLDVAQTPSGGAPPVNTITGLVSSQNTGAGVRALGGSNLKVRGSRFVSNAIGLNIQPFGSNVVFQDDTSKIDFGQSAVGDPGRNVFQSLTGSGQNTTVGVCYGINPNKNQTLYTYGNTWVALVNAQLASVDCTTSTATLTRTSVCAGGIDLGGAGLNGNTVGIAGCQ